MSRGRTVAIVAIDEGSFVQEAVHRVEFVCVHGVREDEMHRRRSRSTFICQRDVDMIRLRSSSLCEQMKSIIAAHSRQPVDCGSRNICACLSCHWSMCFRFLLHSTARLLGGLRDAWLLLDRDSYSRIISDLSIDSHRRHIFRVLRRSIGLLIHVLILRRLLCLLRLLLHRILSFAIGLHLRLLLLGLLLLRSLLLWYLDLLLVRREPRSLRVAVTLNPQQVPDYRDRAGGAGCDVDIDDNGTLINRL
jgi:hypothetical protein